MGNFSGSVRLNLLGKSLKGLEPPVEFRELGPQALCRAASSHLQPLRPRLAVSYLQKFRNASCVWFYECEIVILSVSMTRRLQSGVCLLVLLFANLQLFAAARAEVLSCCSGAICPMSHSRVPDKTSRQTCGSRNHSAKHSQSLECAPGCCQRQQLQVFASNTFVLPQATRLNRRPTIAVLHRKPGSFLVSVFEMIDTPPPRLLAQA